MATVTCGSAFSGLSQFPTTRSLYIFNGDISVARHAVAVGSTLEPDDVHNTTPLHIAAFMATVDRIGMFPN